MNNENEKDLKNKIGDAELKGVSGGLQFMVYSSFEKCTQLLKEAGDRAWACSSPVGLGHYSQLHFYINRAEHTGDEGSRLADVNSALAEMAGGCQAISNVTFSEADYKYVKERLEQVKLAAEHRLGSKTIA